MTERADALANRSERQNEEMMKFLLGLEESDLDVPTQDPGGETVGGVLEHLAEGYAQLDDWEGSGPAAEPEAEHHHDDHGHTHADGTTHSHAPTPTRENGTRARLPRLVEVIGRGGALGVSRLKAMTDEQLDSVPPASPGMASGSEPMIDVSRG